MKSQIFKTAWQFFKQTGLVFSECLKKAWANFKLKEAMQTKVVEFYYKKTNGEMRQAFGRLYDVPEIKDVKQGNENLFTYFDTHLARTTSPSYLGHLIGRMVCSSNNRTNVGMYSFWRTNTIKEYPLK